MKKLIFSLAAIVLTAGAFAQAKADDVAKFKSETIDQGKLQIDVPMTATFVVSNVGSKDLIIESANPTCGCTIGDYTKTPIKPGQTGEIKATYNAKGLGVYEKHMTVKFAGADDMKSITIKGEVLSAEDYAKYKSGGGSSSASTVKPAANNASAIAPVKAVPAKKAAVKKTKAMKTTVAATK